MQITGGKYNSRKIKAAGFENIKPTLSKTRQGIFNTLSAMIDFDGKVFFDMFSGSGIMSLEAVSRGFRAVSFEKDKRTAIAIRETFKTLNIVPELYIGDSLKNAVSAGIKPDVIFLDPPYNSDLYEKALNIIKNSIIKAPDCIIIMEHPVDKIIKYDGFELIKTRIYGNKQITYLIQAE